MPEADFTNNKASKDGLDKLCKSCRQGEKILAAYGMTRERYAEMLAAQNGGCAICGGVNPSGRALAIDHDHSCCPGTHCCGKCVRGLLCSGCNTGIGHLADSPQRLRSAADYLDGFTSASQ